jgi:hypothetical protein
MGTDLLARGDFESAGLFGTPVRGWLTGNQARLVVGSDPGNRLELHITLDSRDPVRTGMKVFDRAFQSSNPAALSVRIRSEGDATVRFYLQRRQIDAGLTDALENGPLTNIGRVDVSDGGWQEFSFDHLMPRLPTKSVRIPVDVQKNGRQKGPVNVRLDDIDWVEWRSPWLNAGDDVAMHATHAQYRVSPRP